MAFYSSVKKECDALNRKNRNVRESGFSFNVEDYWFQTTGKNFAITGGNQTLRNNILATAVKVLRQSEPEPIIILNGNREFEHQIIAMAKQNEIGKLVVSSPDYPNYDLFHGMNSVKIRAIFEEAGRNKGIMNIAELGDYTDAFLEILKKKYVPCLHSMIAMARQNDEAIISFGRFQGVNEWSLDIIKNGIESGRYFRRLLEDFRGAFLSIHSQKSTGFNLVHMANERQIYLLWCRSEFQRIFHAEIASELYSLIANRKNFTLLVNDIELETNDILAEVISTAKDMSGSKVGICCQNIISWANVNERSQKLLINIPALCVLHTGEEDLRGQQELLGQFGTYMHFEQDVSVGGTPGLFYLPGAGAKNVGMVHFERQKVTVEDMQKYSIAVSGHLGDAIGLYKTIKYT